MLEQLRQQSKSFIIWILFGIIILVFIISFGPQANADLGCGASNTYVMKIGDHEVGENSWRFAINGLPRVRPDLTNQRTRPQRAGVAMDLLLMRELLANAAESEGFQVTSDLATDKIKHGEWYLLGFPGNKADYFRDGYFDYDRLEGQSRSFGMHSVENFIDQQKRELLAESMKGLLLGAVQVSRDELLSEFEHNNTTATIDAVKYRPAAYRAKLVLKDADIATYLANHEGDVKKKYEEKEVTYKGTNAAALVRQIFIKRTIPFEAPKPDVKKADAPGDKADATGNKADGTDDPDKKKEVAKAKTDPAEAVATATHKKLAGGADFATMAAKISEDKATAAKGGKLGWRRIDRPGLGDSKLADALKALAPGKTSDVIATPRGYYILRMEDKREGDLSFDQVKLELAEELAATYYAREAARRDANAALAELKTGKKIDELFERASGPPPGAAPPNPNMDQIKRQLGLPPDATMDDVLEKLQQGKGAGGKTGSIIVNGPTVPAEWTGWQGGAQPGPVKPVAKPRIAKPVAKPRIAKPVAKPRIAKPTPAPAAGAPGDEVIPSVEGLEKPKLRTAGPFTRSPASVPGVGESAELVGVIFDGLEKGQLADKVFEVSDGFVLVQLLGREDPDLDSFAEQEPRLRQTARAEKANNHLADWVTTRCKSVVSSGSFSLSAAPFKFKGDKNEDLPLTYGLLGDKKQRQKHCERFSSR